LTAQVQSPPAPTRLTVRQVAAAVVGNALEFFDFISYAFFAVQIGQTFFPGHSAFQSLMLSLMTFGVGFIGRPVGAVVIGAYGDRVGRKPAMILSFLMMSVGVLAMAVTPSYAQIGMAAPIIVLVARLVQGFALGGEVGPTTAFLIEASPPLRRGFYGCWQYGSQNLAHLAAGLIGLALASYMSAATLSAWGWRIPFLIGACVLPVGFLIRSGLTETLAPTERRAPRTPEDQAAFRRAVILGFAMLCSTTVSFGVFTFMTTYAAAILHMPQKIAFGATITWGAFGLMASLAGGALSDRFGRKVVMVWPRLAFLVLILPCFIWLARARTAEALILTVAVLTTLSCLSAGVGLVCLTESIPKSVRSGSLATTYAIAIAVFNGTVQLLVTWLIKVTGDVLWPAYYMAGATALGLIAMALMRETAPVKRGLDWAA
jgi:MHS family citrate/tricarballylate:H+ symporter-like MFS transporter